MARDADGKFIADENAGPDFVPQLPMEAYMNHAMASVTLGAGGAGGVKTIDTGLTVENMGDLAPFGLKWVLFGAVLVPATKASLATFVGTHAVSHIVAQIQRGTKVIGDLKERAHEDVICEAKVIRSSSAEGGFVQPMFVYDLIDPIPVMTRKLTVLIAHSDTADVNSAEWLTILRFGFDALQKTDQTAMAAAAA